MPPRKSRQQAPEAQPDKRAEAKAEHERKLQERASANRALNAQYYELRDHPALVDLLAKAKAFVELHTRIASDAVAYDQEAGTFDKDGNFRPGVRRLQPDERLRELDKAAGIQEVVDYLERRSTLPAPDQS